MMETEKTLSPGLLIRLVIMAAVGPAIIMLAAGDVRWTMGWIFSAFSFAFTLFSRLFIFRRRPDLFRERAESLKKSNVEPWDRILMPILGLVLPLATAVVAGLDHRLQWTRDFPFGLQAAAYGPIIFGAWLALRAAAENAFFSAVVRIQADRGQTVVTTGPYRLVRHPGYAGGILNNAFFPVALGSAWACIPAALLLILTVIRTGLEDRTLMNKLPGYRAYAEKTAKRLVPGVW
jgi:protein-S-isoprenylcysteine O-methyltransferase Ste14